MGGVLEQDWLRSRTEGAGARGLNGRRFLRATAVYPISLNDARGQWTFYFYRDEFYSWAYHVEQASRVPNGDGF
jgi:hypothetical protein